MAYFWRAQIASTLGPLLSKIRALAGSIYM